MRNGDRWAENKRKNGVNVFERETGEKINTIRENEKKDWLLISLGA